MIALTPRRQKHAASATLSQREREELDLPVVDRAGVLVIALDICGDEVGIVLNHFEIGVTQQILQRDHLAAVTEVLSCERMAKSMRVDVLDAGAISQAAQHVAQGVATQAARIAVVDIEEIVVRPGRAHARLQILP